MDTYPAWLGELKGGLLAIFFIFFCGVLTWMLGRSGQAMEAYGSLPLQDEAGDLPPHPDQTIDTAGRGEQHARN